MNPQNDNNIINSMLNGKIYTTGTFSRSTMSTSSAGTASVDTDKPERYDRIMSNLITAEPMDNEQRGFLRDVINNEKLLVLEAPGGTGKSTTIVNLINFRVGLQDGNKILVMANNNEALVELANSLAISPSGKKNVDKIVVVISTHAKTGRLYKATMINCCASLPVSNTKWGVSTKEEP